MKTRHEGIGLLIADVSRLMRRAFARHLEDGQITLNEARALASVARNPGLRQVDLAELLEVQPIQLARSIDRLAELKLVARQPVAGDRRAYHIHLLPASTDVLAWFEKLKKLVGNEAMDGLSEEQISAMTVALEHIRNNLNRR